VRSPPWPTGWARIAEKVNLYLAVADVKTALRALR
jgi:hypothetical protein